MKMGWWKSAGLGTAVAALALLTWAPNASAQAGDRECQCVDADGNAIENCTCFVIPDVPDMSEAFAWSPDGDFMFSFGSARPRLGVTVSREQDDAIDAQGARVGDVMEDGPADEAGLREGDIITSVDGRSLSEPLDDDVEEDLDLDESIPVQRLLLIARDLEPGQTVEIGYLRDGEAGTATVEVRDLGASMRAWARQFRQDFEPRMERFRQEIRPRVEEFRREMRPQIDELREQIREQSRQWERDGQVLGDFEPFMLDGSYARYGLRLTELTPGLGEYFGTDRGVLVTDVDDDSALGLRAGDVILRVGDREVTSPSRVLRTLSSYDEGENVTFRVRRQGSEIDVMGRLSD
jgi:C-terminal processing protease CtpA/Prc